MTTISILHKKSDLVIPQNDPFKNDAIGVKPYCDNLSKLISTITQPFVLSIEAPWGYGKTAFVNIWKTDLEQNNYLCIYFNAWETDFFEEPLISFVSEIQDSLSNRLLDHQDDKIAKPLQEFIKAGEKVVSIGIPIFAKAITLGAVDRRNYLRDKKACIKK